MADKVTPEQITEQQTQKTFFGMTLTPTKKQKATKKILITVSPSPLANFLPERVQRSKDNVFVRRRLFAASVATLSVSFLAYLASTVLSFSGTMLLNDAELRFSTVKAEQAKYAAVRDLENKIRFQEASLFVATATEIDIEGLIRLLTQQLPEGAQYFSTQVSAFSGTTTNTTGLTEPYSVEVALSIELLDYPSLQLFLDRLPLLPGFYDSKLSSVSETPTGITASVAVYFTPELYTRPFMEALILGDPVPPGVLDTEPLVAGSEGLELSTEDTDRALATTAPTATPTASPAPRPTASPAPSPTPTAGVDE